MKDALDVATDDPELGAEITLLAEVMAAGRPGNRGLDPAAIDAVLHTSSLPVELGPPAARAS